MRLYTADARSHAISEAAWHCGIALSIAIAYFARVLPSVAWLLIFWHLNQSRIRRARAKEFQRVPSGYIDITPGIQVVRLRSDRDRTREPEVPLRN
jgi:hypothetical protein